MTALRLKNSYDEIGNIRTFVFETEGKTWLAGQYQTYEFPQIEGDKKSKKHYFTIASAPSEKEIHISTRMTDSVFKKTLNAMRPGDSIEARNIEGDFTWENDEPVVFIAAGIGVTPYRSILLDRASNGKSLNAHLIYFVRDNNFAFRDEFDAIASTHPELKIDYVVGEPVTVENILKYAPEAKEIVTYISGPESMVDILGNTLKAEGVTVKQDWFPGYTEDSF
jgi:ferredoxin-NADP reductase